MPRLTKIYTKTGDAGLTGLGGGRRVSKDSARVRAYGTVDELNSAIGVALALGLSDRLARELTTIQNELFDLGSDLCWPSDDERRARIPTVQPHHVEKLERLIDELNEVVGPLTNFLLPGGSDPWLGGWGAFRVSEPAVDRFPQEVWSRLLGHHGRQGPRAIDDRCEQIKGVGGGVHDNTHGRRKVAVEVAGHGRDGLDASRRRANHDEVLERHDGPIRFRRCAILLRMGRARHLPAAAMALPRRAELSFHTDD